MKLELAIRGGAFALVSLLMSTTLPVSAQNLGEASDTCRPQCPGRDCPSSCRRDGPARADRRIEPLVVEQDSPAAAQPQKRRDEPQRGEPVKPPPR